MFREIVKNIPKMRMREWAELVVMAGFLFIISLYVVYLYIASLVYNLPLPVYTFAIALGTFLGASAYIIDAFSHRAMRKKIQKQEHLVHYFIFFGAVLPFLISVVLAYWVGIAALPFSIMFFILGIGYVSYDEAAFHWKRAIMLEQLVHWLLIWGMGVAEIALFYWAYVDQYAGLAQLLAYIG